MSAESQNKPRDAASALSMGECLLCLEVETIFAFLDRWIL